MSQSTVAAFVDVRFFRKFEYSKTNFALEKRLVTTSVTENPVAKEVASLQTYEMRRFEQRV